MESGHYDNSIENGNGFHTSKGAACLGYARMCGLDNGVGNFGVIDHYLSALMMP